MPARVSLALFYLAHFGTLGVYLPYFTLYLERLGFDPFQIAVVAALQPLVRATAPILWGLAADHSGQRWRLTVTASALGAATLTLLLGASRFETVCVVMALYGFFISGTLPLVEATTLETVASGEGGYGLTRVWGSIGFIAIAGLWGWVLDHAVIRWVVYGLVGFSGSIFLAALGVPRPAAHPHAAEGAAAWRPPRLVIGFFFASTLLQQASHGPYYAYFSLHLQEMGWSRAAIGLAWMVGVLSEVVMMVRSERLAARWGLPALLAATHVAAVVRWMLLAWLTAPGAILLSQTLHAVTFGAFHVSAVRRTQALFPPGRRGFGQSLFSALTYGAGSALGMLGGGLLHARLGARGLFAAAAGAAILSLAAQGVADLLARRGARF
jgi:PPP family 3-phenylpropionic acid transporter